MSKDRAWPGSQTQTTRDAGSAPSRSARYAIQPTEQSLLAVPDLALARYVATSRARHIPGELEDANDLRDNPGRDAGLGLNLHGGHRTAGQGQEDGCCSSRTLASLITASVREPTLRAVRRVAKGWGGPG